MNALELRRRTLGKGVYKKTVEGNPAIAQGSLTRRYPGITMQGWTEQAQYEGKNLFDISDFETNNKGIIENGTILFKQSLGTVTYSLNLKAGKYSISCKRSGYAGINIKVNEVVVINNSGSANFTGDFDVSDGDSVVLEFSEGQNPNGEDRMIYDIMLNSGSTALPYEPYTGGQPSPSPDYPQEIVSAGNYDEGTGKYQYTIKISDSEESHTKSQTVTLTSDRPLTKCDKLEKRNGQWGWVYGSVEVDMSSEVTWDIHQGYEQETSNLFRGVMSGVDKIDSTDMLLCNILPYYQNASADRNGIYSLDNNFFARIVGIKSLEEFQEKIQGGKVLTKLSTETFVPITESEQEAMNALHTYRPTTVLTNQQDCEMVLTYKTRKSMEATA